LTCRCDLQRRTKRLLGWRAYYAQEQTKLLFLYPSPLPNLRMLGTLRQVAHFTSKLGDNERVWLATTG